MSLFKEIEDQIKADNKQSENRNIYSSTVYKDNPDKHLLGTSRRVMQEKADVYLKEINQKRQSQLDRILNLEKRK